MRLRRKPWAVELIRQHPHLVIPDPQNWKGRWQEAFPHAGSIHLEIGIGKGGFLVEMAKAHPQLNFVGVELYSTLLGVALRKLLDAQQEMEISNCLLFRADAAQLTAYFAPGEVERIYLNFSDPWPKRRHAKRRLTHPAFLEVYRSILVPKGELHLKTDNELFFEFSLNSLADFGCRLRNITFDLHKSEIEDNIMTEYEQKFVAKGMRIYRCEAIFP